MKKYFVMAAAAIMAAVSAQAQTKRSDDFRARYELKDERSEQSSSPSYQTR